MSFFTSYAQNCEDVLLWRVLQHVKNGFYIDVGANDPEEHSVTKAFYERGWYGINIEPLPCHQASFAEERPRDINLAIAAGSQNGELTLYDVPQVRGWASPDRAVAASHRAQGHMIAELRVPVRRLDSICEQYVDRPIHFLKIDVEGFEGEVLRGMDFVRWRPWVVVVEATLPNSQQTNHQQWEHLITEHGYQFGYFDGLNRYYVADEQAQLLPVIAIPVNVFDVYVTCHLVKAWAERDQAREELAHTRHRLDERQLLVEDLQAKLTRMGSELWDARQRLEQQLAQVQALQARYLETQSALQENQRALLHSQELVLSERHVKEQYAQLAHSLQPQLASAEQLAGQHASAAQQLQILQSSLSWRITRPLRALKRLAHRMLAIPRRARAKSQDLFLWVVHNEALRKILIPVIKRIPVVQQHLRQTVAQVRNDPAPPPFSARELALPADLRELPESARHIFADLTQRPE